MSGFGRMVGAFGRSERRRNAGWARGRRRVRRGAFAGRGEHLESRALLAVTAQLVGTDLQIDVDSSDANSTAYVRLVGGDIEVADNAAFLAPLTGSFLATAVESITVTGAALGGEGLVLADGALAVSLESNLVETVVFENAASVTKNVAISLVDGDLTVTDVVGGQSVSLASPVGRLSLAGTIEANALDLQAGSGIEQSVTDEINAPTVNATSDGGDIELIGSANTIGTFVASNTAAGGGVQLFTDGALTVGDGVSGIVTSNGDVVLSAGGGVTQVTGSQVTAASLQVFAGSGNIVLDDTGNAIGALACDLVGGGTVTVEVSGALVIGVGGSGVSAPGGDVVIVAGGAITQAAGAGIVADSLSVETSGGGIVLSDFANTVGSLGAVNTDPAGNLEFATSAALAIGVGGVGVVVAGSTSLFAGGTVTQSPGVAITAGSLFVSTTVGDVVLTDSGNTVSSFAATNLAVGGDVLFTNSTALTLGVGGTAIETIAGRVEVTAAGSLVQAVGTAIVCDTMIAVTTSGDIDLSSASNEIGAFAATNTAAGGAVTVVNAQSVVVGVGGLGISTVDGDITVQAYGNIIVTGPLVYGTGTLTLQTLGSTPGDLVLVVTNDGDSGAGSLRQALGLLLANSTAGQPTVIVFDSAVSLVSLTAALPAISKAVTIDGSGPVVRIDGTGAGAGVVGFDFVTGGEGSRLQNVSITGFEAAGVRIQTSLVEVTGSLIGVTPAGLAVGNGYGIVVTGVDATAVTIGGQAAGNVISGNQQAGVWVTSGGGAALLGNVIGLSADGFEARPNGGAGVLLDGSAAVTIGGLDALARNIISGNGGAGIRLENGAAGTVIEGNWIGLSSTGAEAVGNGASGIVADGTDVDVRIGNDIAAAGNVISGNGGSGIEIANGSSANEILFNMIGLDATGTAELGNALSGIAVTGPSTAITIGQLGAGNTISGNLQHGIFLASGSSNATIVGNVIGLDAGGSLAIGNVLDGVHVVGAVTTTVSANVVSGNGGDGVSVTGATATGTKILGNIVGLSSAGIDDLGNGGDGIAVRGVPAVIIGGLAGEERNVVSGNAGAGIRIGLDGPVGSTQATVIGNYVGTDVTGGVALGNDADGIVVDGEGSDGAVVSTNLVSGNAGSGVRVTGGAVDSTIVANSVGVTAGRDAALGNGDHGIVVDGGGGHLIGGSAADANVVSGNGGRGIVVANGDGNEVSWNLVGVNGGGRVALGNASDGVAVIDAVRTLISANLISANGGSGVAVTGADASETTIVGNLLGTDTTGLFALGNTQHGVVITGSSSTVVGGATAADRNVIAANGDAGIAVQGAVQTRIERNYIGVTANGYSALGNGGSGIFVTGAAETVVTGANVIAFNGVAAAGHGIWVEASSDTTIGDPAGGQASGNSVYRNAQQGIRIDGESLGTLIVGNFVGTTPRGTLGLGNGGAGIAIVASNGSVVGGRVGGPGEPVLGNLVVGNVEGISLTDAVASDLASGNVVLGNVVRRNSGAGIVLVGSSFQTVGGAAVTDGNQIVQNGGDGIRITNALLAGGSGLGGNVVAGNAVGTDPSGSLSVGNVGDGIVVLASFANVVGGDGDRGNVVASNRHGIRLVFATSPSEAEANVVGGNLVVRNSADGIRVESSALNVIGTSVDRNVTGNTVVSNSGFGIVVAGASSVNSVVGNFIGTDVEHAARGNAKVGLLIEASSATTASANVIAWNKGAGVSVTGGFGNAIGTADDGAGNDIHANSGLGVSVTAGAAATSISGNRIDSNGQGGVAVRGASETRIDGGNVIVRNKRVGVSISSGAGNVVAGNFIGTDATGESRLGNVGGGIVISAEIGTVVGGPDSRNVVVFNTGDGISVTDSRAAVPAEGIVVSDNVVQANSGHGISVIGGGYTTVAGNDVGGMAAGDGNAGSGISLSRGAFESTIVGNVVIGNGAHGVDLTAVHSNFVGGDTTEAANVIGLNRGSGVNVTAGSTGNVLAGNFIGRYADDSTSLPNVADGVTIHASVANQLVANRIYDNGRNGIAVVSALAGAGVPNIVSANMISGNAVGVAITSSRNVLVSGGNMISGNIGDGVLVGVKSSAVMLQSNEIEGNGGDGVEVNGSRAVTLLANDIAGNAIAGIRLLQASGTSLADGNRLFANRMRENAGPGLSLEASSFNTIGGAGGANSIFANGGDGIALLGGSNANVVEGNSVGSDADGGEVEGNQRDGIRITGSYSNVMRGGNEIVNNGGAGVRILNAFATTPSAGNRIVTNTIAENAKAGVVANGGAHTIGGSSAATGNVIAANGGYGVSLGGTATSGRVPGATVRNNRIIANAGIGVAASGGGRNTIATNTIGGHGIAGVQLSASVSNLVVGNAIGGEAGANNTGIALINAGQNQVMGNVVSENEGDGIAITGARSNDNVIGSRLVGLGAAGATNTVALNQGAGVRVVQGVRNQIGGNSIYGNGDGGIVLASGGNSMQAAPTLLAARRIVTGSWVQLEVTGEVRGAPRQRMIVEVFATDGDDVVPSGSQGRTPVGRITVTVGVNGVGVFTSRLNVDVAAGQFLTALATTASGVSGNTSEFSMKAVPVT